MTINKEFIEEMQRVLLLIAHELIHSGNKLQTTQDKLAIPQNLRDLGSDLLLLRTKLIAQSNPLPQPENIVLPGVNMVPSALRAAPMGLFPTMASLQSVVDMAISQLPINTPNAVNALLMTYHNTLLDQVQACKS